MLFQPSGIGTMATEQQSIDRHRDRTESTGVLHAKIMVWEKYKEDVR